MTDEYAREHNEYVLEALLQITTLRVFASRHGHESLARDCDDVYEYVKRRLMLEEVEV